MLNVKNCLVKANRNKMFISQNASQIIDRFPDWVTVIAFYSALHFVDAHLLKHHNIQREHHEEREREVSMHMGEIYSQYKRLFEMGFRSRYLRVEDNPTSDEAKNAVQDDLPKIEKYVMEHMT